MYSYDTRVARFVNTRMWLSKGHALDVNPSTTLRINPSGAIRLSLLAREPEQRELLFTDVQYDTKRLRDMGSGMNLEAAVITLLVVFLLYS